MSMSSSRETRCCAEASLCSGNYQPFRGQARQSFANNTKTYPVFFHKVTDIDLGVRFDTTGQYISPGQLIDIIGLAAGLYFWSGFTRRLLGFFGIFIACMVFRYVA